jgi:hypothetical protein
VRAVREGDALRRGWIIERIVEFTTLIQGDPTMDRVWRVAISVLAVRGGRKGKLVPPLRVPPVREADVGQDGVV